MKNSEMLNNLYKILRMNIILAKSSGEIVTEDTLQSFYDTAKKLDEDSNNKYENEIKDLYYTTKTLDEEVNRLEKLINFIDKRLDERNTLLVDYKETTNRELESLSYIKDEDKIEDYKKRLNDIKTYLSNKENIAKIEDELVELHSKLDKDYENKKNDEENNVKLEEELLSSFKDCLSMSDYKSIINATDIDFELEKIRPEEEEQLKTLNTFKNAYNNLLRAGISRDNQEEYANYVMEAKRSYYDVKEKVLLYNMYKIIKNSKSIYSELYDKRDELDNVLEERLNLRVDMSINNEDILNSLYTVIDKQNKIIVGEKNVLDNISETEDTIKFKETRLNELKEDNQRVDILSLLQEYGIIETYDVHVDDKIEINENNSIENSFDFSYNNDVNNAIDESKANEEIVNNNVDVSIPNMVVQVKDAYPNLNISFARSKADTVMRRVGRSLGYTPETKKENIVTFDFNNNTNNNDNEVKEEVKQDNNSFSLGQTNEFNQEVPHADLQPQVEVNNSPVNNSLSSLNFDDLNLDLKLDSKEPDDEKINDFSNNNVVNPIFPNIGASNSNIDTNNDVNVDNNIDSKIDKDFWSADEDKEIFPSVLANNDVAINKDESGFKLGSPLDIGGYDENRN